jgi:hypothetical protein
VRPHNGRRRSKVRDVSTNRARNPNDPNEEKRGVSKKETQKTENDKKDCRNQHLLQLALILCCQHLEQVLCLALTLLRDAVARKFETKSTSRARDSNEHGGKEERK